MKPVPLRRRTLSALLWSGVGQYGASGVRLVALLALGWLLPPSDFGLLALGLIFVIFAEGIGELGMVFALVQHKDVDQSTLDTAFWSNLALSLALAVGTFLWAEPITAFLGDPRAAPLLRLLVVIFIANAFSIVPRAVLIKALTFRKVALAQLFGEIGYAVVGLAMAWQGFGVWSLAGAVLVQRCVITTILWTAVEWRPGLGFNRVVFRQLLRFGGPVMAGTVAERVVLNADYFVIGRLLGVEALGYYSLAFQLAYIPLDRLISFIGRVAFPAFSLVQTDTRRLTKGLLDGLRHMLVVALPVVISIVVLGPGVLRAIYDQKWEPSTVPLRILGLAGLCLIPRLVEAALLAVGMAKVRLWLPLVRLAVFSVLVLSIGLRFGINGIAASVAGGLIVWAGAVTAIGMRTFDVGWRRLWASVWPSVRAALVAMTPLALFLLVPPSKLGYWGALAYAGASMGIIYLAMIWPAYRGWFKRSASVEPPSPV